MGREEVLLPEEELFDEDSLIKISAQFSVLSVFVLAVCYIIACSVPSTNSAN